MFHTLKTEVVMKEKDAEERVCIYPCVFKAHLLWCLSVHNLVWKRGFGDPLTFHLTSFFRPHFKTLGPLCWLPQLYLKTPVLHSQPYLNSTVSAQESSGFIYYHGDMEEKKKCPASFVHLWISHSDLSQLQGQDSTMMILQNCNLQQVEEELLWAH